MDADQEATYQRMMSTDKSDPNWIAKTCKMADEYHREREARERKESFLDFLDCRGWSLFIGAVLGGAGLIGLRLYAAVTMSSTAQ